MLWEEFALEHVHFSSRNQEMLISEDIIIITC